MLTKYKIDKFIERSNKISMECMYLRGNAVDLQLDTDEWRACDKTMKQFVEELNKVRRQVEARAKEVGE